MSEQLVEDRSKRALARRCRVGAFVSAIMGGLLLIGAARLFAEGNGWAWLRLGLAAVAFGGVILCMQNRRSGPVTLQVVLWAIGWGVWATNICAHTPGWREAGSVEITYAVLLGTEYPYLCNGGQLGAGAAFLVLGAVIGNVGLSDLRRVRSHGGGGDAEVE